MTSCLVLSPKICVCFILKWESICSDIIRAVHSLHLKGILHNDLHCNNALLRGDCHVKMIDFGKCTLIKDPVIYAIEPGSEKQKPYNKYHCHLEYELRHFPGSKVSCKTDIYSIGYIFNVIPNKCDIDGLSKITKPLLNHLLEERPELPGVLVEINKKKGK